MFRNPYHLYLVAEARQLFYIFACETVTISYFLHKHLSNKVVFKVKKWLQSSLRSVQEREKLKEISLIGRKTDIAGKIGRNWPNETFLTTSQCCRQCNSIRVIDTKTDTSTAPDRDSKKGGRGWGVD